MLKDKSLVRLRQFHGNIISDKVCLSKRPALEVKALKNLIRSLIVIKIYKYRLKAGGKNDKKLFWFDVTLLYLSSEFL